MISTTTFTRDEPTNGMIKPIVTHPNLIIYNRQRSKLGLVQLRTFLPGPVSTGVNEKLETQ